MVVVQVGRNWILPSEDLVLVGGFLLLILHIFLLWKILPLLLAVFMKMKMKKSGTRVIKRRRNAKLAVLSGKEYHGDADLPEEDVCEERCINSVLPPEIVGHILQNLHMKQHCKEASRVCSQWFLSLAQLELQRRRLSRHCLRPARRIYSGKQTADEACRGKKLVQTLDQASGIPLAACLLRLCKQHTKGLIIRDARNMSTSDYKLLSVFGDNLVDLTIQNCYSLDNRTLVSLLDGCTSLRSLHLTVTSGLNDQAASGIARKCPKLQELHLIGCYGISANGVMSLLHGCPELEKLQLKAMGLTAEVDSVKAAVPVVPEGPGWNLRVLGLTSSDLVTDELLASMAPRLRNLQQLDVSNCRLVTDAGVSMLIQECQGTLKDLKVKGCAVSDATLTKLARSGSNMRLLSVANCQGVTDCGLRAIADAEKMPSLRHLCISACSGVTDKGLEHLAKRQKKMTRLRILDVQACPDISARGPKKILSDQMVVIS